MPNLGKGMLRAILSENIKELRNAQGLTQEHLAEKADLSAAYIRMLESGKNRNASLKAVESIAFALGVDASKLFTMKPPSSEASRERVRRGIKILFYEFVRDTLQDIGDMGE